MFNKKQKGILSGLVALSAGCNHYQPEGAHFNLIIFFK